MRFVNIHFHKSTYSIRNTHWPPLLNGPCAYAMGSLACLKRKSTNNSEGRNIHRYLGKLNAYGLSDKSCSLVSNYLSNRKQRVKLGPHYSEWADIARGVPQLPKALFLALFFSIFLLMIFFTFWISPLCTIMLMRIPCLMLTQIMTL